MNKRKNMVDFLLDFLIPLFLIISAITGMLTCNSKLEERDQRIKKYNEQQIEICFPGLFVRETEIDDVKYIICRSEPKSKDFKLKEFSKKDD